MEDILEEVFWEITDEYDEEEWKIHKLTEKSWRISWDTEIEKINKFFKIKIWEEEYKTISYFLLKKMQKIPEKWDFIKEWNFTFHIEKMSENKIEFIRITKI